MQAKFFCRTGTLAGSDHRIGEEATIGRGARNTIVLADSAVSKSHARITFDAPAGAYYLQDLDSTNGTRLDGVPVSGRRRLGDLHVVTLGGRHDFIFAILPDEGRPDEGRRGRRNGAEHAEAAPAASMGPAAPDAPASAPDVAGPVEPAPRGGPDGARAEEAARRGPRRSGVARQPVEAAATRFEAAGDLQVPPLEAGPGDGGPSGAAAPTPGGGLDRRDARQSEVARQPVAPAATRFEAAGDLQVPPLEAGPGAGGPSGAVAPTPGGGLDRRDARQSEVARQPVAPAATRFEAAGDLQVPPLEAGPGAGGPSGAAAPAPGGGLDGEAAAESAAPAPGGGLDGEAAAESAEPATRVESSPTLDAPPLGAAPAPSSSVVIEVAPADGEPYRVTLGDGRHVLGRAKDCDVPIDDRTLSRRHAAFVVRAGTVTVGDLHSLNGTFMDGKPVEAATEVAIGRAVMFGDRVKVVRVAP